MSRWALLAIASYAGFAVVLLLDGRLGDAGMVAVLVLGGLCIGSVAASLVHWIRKDILEGRLRDAPTRTSFLRLWPMAAMVLLGGILGPWYGWATPLLLLSAMTYLCVDLLVELAGSIWARQRGFAQVKPPDEPVLAGFALVNILLLTVGPLLPPGRLSVLGWGFALAGAAVVASMFAIGGGQFGDPACPLATRLEGILHRAVTLRERLALAALVVVDGVSVALLIWGAASW